MGSRDGEFPFPFSWRCGFGVERAWLTWGDRPYFTAEGKGEADMECTVTGEAVECTKVDVAVTVERIQGVL